MSERCQQPQAHPERCGCAPAALRCQACNSPRTGESCHKCGGALTPKHPSWDEPALPPIDRIRALAREVGYAIGEHGSKERDLDLIAAPWTDEAVSAEQLAQHIADGLGGKIAGIAEDKPAGRYAVNIQMSGWFKLIDLSICPIQSGPSTEEDDLELAPAEILASRLIDAWCDAHGKKIPWAKAVEISGIVTKQPQGEIDRLLAMGDAAPAAPQQLALPPEAEGSAAQKSFWAGFEAAHMSGSTNIRDAWNSYKATDEFARLNPSAQVATYTTQAGESLMGIANRQLRGTDRWKEIRELNADRFPDMGPHDYYPVGTVLKMPDRSAQGEKP